MYGITTILSPGLTMQIGPAIVNEGGLRPCKREVQYLLSGGGTIIGENEAGFGEDLRCFFVKGGGGT